MVKKTDEQTESTNQEVEQQPLPLQDASETPPVEAVPVDVDEDLETKVARLEKQACRVTKAHVAVKKAQTKVDLNEQAVKSAQATLKASIGARDRAVLELGRIIDDVKSGQQVLPGTDEDESESQSNPAVEPSGTAENWPISILGNKQLKLVVGDEAFAAAKNSDDPIGLSDKQIEALEAAEFPTIGELEKQMRENSYWHAKVAKNPAAAIIQRVISSLLAFRKVNPIHANDEPDEKSQTILESLAEKNAEQLTPVSAETSA